MHRSQDGNAKWRAETEQSGTNRNKLEQGGLCWNRPLENPSEHEEVLLTLQCRELETTKRQALFDKLRLFKLKRKK